MKESQFEFNDFMNHETTSSGLELGNTILRSALEKSTTVDELNANYEVVRVACCQILATMSYNCQKQPNGISVDHYLAEVEKITRCLLIEYRKAETGKSAHFGQTVEATIVKGQDEFTKH